MSYYVTFCAKDCYPSIWNVMSHLVNQTRMPEKIIVIDDGSVDGTRECLLYYQKEYPQLIECYETYNEKRDYKRIPKLWNMGLRKDYDYHMILAGDASLELNYAEELLKELEDNPNLVIISGGYGIENFNRPIGGGRFVRQSFFFKHYKEYPQIIGYETEILERALMNGYELKVRNDIKLEHHDKLGKYHSFIEFGYGMRALGYNPLYAFGRILINFFFNKQIGKKGALQMLWFYLTFSPQKEGYYRLHSKDIRKFVSSRQQTILKEWFIKILRKPLK